MGRYMIVFCSKSGPCLGSRKIRHLMSCVSETGALNSEQNWSLFYSLDTLDTSDSLCTLSSFFHK